MMTPIQVPEILEVFEAMGLPKYSRSCHVKMDMEELITIECEFIASLDGDMIKPIQILKEKYCLVKKEGLDSLVDNLKELIKQQHSKDGLPDLSFAEVASGIKKALTDFQHGKEEYCDGKTRTSTDSDGDPEGQGKLESKDKPSRAEAG